MQVINLRGIDGSVEAGHALCKALAKLPELSSVKVDEAEKTFLSGMAPSIPLLTQTRYILHCPYNSLPGLYTWLSRHLLNNQIDRA